MHSSQVVAGLVSHLLHLSAWHNVHTDPSPPYPGKQISHTLVGSVSQTAQLPTVQAVQDVKPSPEYPTTQSSHILSESD